MTGKWFRHGWVAFMTLSITLKYIVQFSKGLSCPALGEMMLLYALMMGGWKTRLERKTWL